MWKENAPRSQLTRFNATTPNNCCTGAATPMGYRKPKAHGGPVNIVVSPGGCS